MKSYLTQIQETMKLQFLFYASLLALNLSAAEPTQTIRGSVTDKLTQIPLPGANITLIHTDPVTGTITDLDGRFELKGIPIGRVSIRVTYVGYHPVEYKNLLLYAGKEMVLQVMLEEKIIAGEEVTVAARKKSESINKMASVSARTFSVAETERYAGARNDVARMASNYAGVANTDDSRNDIIIRGNSPTGLLWRFEGVDIPNPNHFGATGTTGGPVSMLNNTLLANSDFLTGAFPAEYGNALAGVFDIRMRSGNKHKHEFLGQVGFNGFEAGAEGPISKENQSSYLINYRYSTFALFDDIGMISGTTGIPNYQDLSFKIDMPKSPVGQLSLFGLVGNSNIEIWDSKLDSAENSEDLYSAGNQDLTNKSRMGVVGLNHRKIINSTTYTSLTLAATHHYYAVIIDSLTNYNGDLFPLYRNNFVQEKLYGRFFVNKKINRQLNFKTGLNLQRKNFTLVDSMFNYNFDAFSLLTNSEGHFWLIQPWIQGQYNATENLTFNAGIHYQHLFMNNSYSLEPRMGMRWSINNRNIVSLGYGLHSQLPPITFYFNLHRNEDGSYTKTNSNLDFSKSHHLVGGYEYLINDFTRIKTELYAQYLFDIPVAANESSAYSSLNEGANFFVASPDFLTNSGTGINYGSEITLEQFLNKGFYYLFTASLFDSKYHGSNEIEFNTAFSSNYIANLLMGKAFYFNNNSSLAIDVKGIISGGKRYTPYTIMYNEEDEIYYRDYDESSVFAEKFKDYIRADFKISYNMNSKKRNLTQQYSIEITNLLNRQNIFMEDFDKFTGETKFIYQLPFMLIPQYRITF